MFTDKEKTIYMDDEFKKIKFRKNGVVYTAHAIDISGNNNVNGNFMIWTGAFRIYDEDNNKLVAKICFQQSMLLDYLWANSNKERFPKKEYLEESLVNLLHYLPFDKDTLTLDPNGESYIFRFVRDFEDGRQENTRFYNIKVSDSIEKTYQRIMFGDTITDDKILKSILEPLYMHRFEDYTSSLLIDYLFSVLPFDKNKIGSQIELLEYNKYIEVLRNALGEYVSVKISPLGLAFLTKMTNKQKTNTIKNIQYGHNFNINTGDHSPVNINADIDTSFNSIKKEIEEKNPSNKDELLEDLDSLQTEVKEIKDINKIKNLLNKIGKATEWVGRRVEPIVQQVIASYISSQIPKTPIL